MSSSKQKEALGITIGDRVKTSYGTGPYRVESIWGPFWWTLSYHLTVWPYPVISLGLSYVGVSGKHHEGLGINNIHQDGCRWFTDQGDEVFVEKDRKSVFRQLDIFSVLPSASSDQRTAPYKFDPSVDYSDQNHVFHCWECHRDFNGDKWNGGYANPHCPYCHAWVARTVIVMGRVIPGQRYWSEYQRYLGFSGQPA
jgi:hypothetical protein